MSSRRRIPFSHFSPVIPAKAGIHKLANSLATRNQAPSAMRAGRPRSQDATDR